MRVKLTRTLIGEAVALIVALPVIALTLALLAIMVGA